MLGSNPSADPGTRPKPGTTAVPRFVFGKPKGLRDGTQAINPLIKKPFLIGFGSISHFSPHRLIGNLLFDVSRKDRTGL
jgi:hypothetical protein